MRSLRALSDEQLLERTPGDPRAFGEFYDRHAARVMGVIRRRTGSSEVALDVTAEVFAAALDGCGRFEARHDGSAVAWLYAIARNHLAELYRTRAVSDRARQRLAMQPIVLTDEAIERLERRLDAQSTDIDAALEGLPLPERDAIHARIVDEREYADIAAQFDVSESVVRQRVHRGLKKLRSTMEDRDDR